MAVEAGQAVLTVVPSARGFRGRLSSEIGPEAEAAGEDAGKSFSGRFLAVAGAAIIGGGILLFKGIKAGLKATVPLASDLNETISKTEVLFGQDAKAVLRFSQGAATGLGQSQRQALDAAAGFAIFGKSAGLRGKELVGFSTGLVRTSTDMASFANTTPTEAVEAIGAALRGENEPIRKYGVLINDAALRQKALQLGIVKTTKTALTPQQRVLAAQGLILDQLGKKGSKTLGDFTRTQAGLANQQRISAALWTDLKTRIGGAFLPVVLKLQTTLNTKLLPALNKLWSKHGKEITAFLSEAADKAGPFIDKFATFDFSGLGRDLSKAFGSLKGVVPDLRAIGGSVGTGFVDTLRLGGIVIKFLADHSDTFAKLLPAIVVGFLAVKAAQAAGNAAMAIAIPLRIAEVVATHRQTVALRAHRVALLTSVAASRTSAVATATDTAATNLGFFARTRATAGLVVHRVVTLAVRAATIAWTAVQWLLNAALTANPIGLVIAAIAILIGVIILVAKKTRFFQTVWGHVWSFLKMIGRWFAGPFAQFFIGVWNRITADVKRVREWIVKQFNQVVTFLTVTVPGKIRSGASRMWNSLRDSFLGVVNGIIRGWNAIDFSIHLSIPSWIPGIGGRGFHVDDIVPDIPYLQEGGRILKTGIAVVHRNETVLPARVADVPLTGDWHITGAPGQSPRELATLIRRELAWATGV